MGSMLNPNRVIVKDVKVCYVLWLKSVKGMGLALDVWGWSLVVVRKTIQLKYPNRDIILDNITRLKLPNIQIAIKIIK